jgi:hypothetical protein
MVTRGSDDDDDNNNNNNNNNNNENFGMIVISIIEIGCKFTVLYGRSL